MDDVLAEVRSRLASEPHPSYERFYFLLMDVLARQNGASRCGDKTHQENVRYLDELRAMFPALPDHPHDPEIQGAMWRHG